MSGTSAFAAARGYSVVVADEIAEAGGSAVAVEAAVATSAGLGPERVSPVVVYLTSPASTDAALSRVLDVASARQP